MKNIINGAYTVFNPTFNFSVGDMVGCNETARAGEITKRWSKLQKIDNENYLVEVKYTLRTERGFLFKANEADLVLMK